MFVFLKMKDKGNERQVKKENEEIKTKSFISVTNV